MSVKKRIAIVLAVLASLPAAGFGFLYWKISHPPVTAGVLPAGLVSFNTPEGRALLAGAEAHADADVLLPVRQTQEKGSWCGVASSAVVLTALEGHRVSQTDVIDHASDVRSFMKVTFGGMPLEVLGRYLEANGAHARVVHAGDSDVGAFREELRANLARAGDFLVVNYARSALQQGDSGHFSPLAAYDADTDRVLVLDTAAYKWPPTWVKVDALFAAMNTVDSDGGKTRGWVVVSR